MTYYNVLKAEHLSSLAATQVALYVACHQDGVTSADMILVEADDTLSGRYVIGGLGEPLTIAGTGAGHLPTLSATVREFLAQTPVLALLAESNRTVRVQWHADQDGGGCYQVDVVDSTGPRANDTTARPTEHEYALGNVRWLLTHRGEDAAYDRDASAHLSPWVWDFSSDARV